MRSILSARWIGLKILIMLKQSSSSRNQRSKKLKVKHALQICLLLVICAWLLYHVKQKNGKGPVEMEKRKDENVHEMIKLGRKDLNPQLDEIAAEFEKHGEDDEDDPDRDESKRRMNKQGEEKGGTDELSDQLNAEEESEQSEDLIDEDDQE